MYKRIGVSKIKPPPPSHTVTVPPTNQKRTTRWTRMNTQTQNTEQGGFLSLREFAKKFEITKIVLDVRENTNGYSFLVFINKDGNTENVYFGSSIARDYPEGTAVTTEMLDKLQIYEYPKEGKMMLRLVRKGGSNGNTASIDSLL